MKRKTIITTSARHKQWSMRPIEHRFRIVKQLPFHFAPQQIRGLDKTKQVRFYLLFNFHLQFTNNSVGSLRLCTIYFTKIRFCRLRPPA